MINKNWIYLPIAIFAMWLVLAPLALLCDGQIVLNWKDNSAPRDIDLIVDTTADTITINGGWTGATEHWNSSDDFVFKAVQSGFVDFDITDSMFASEQALIDSGISDTWGFAAYNPDTDTYVTHNFYSHTEGTAGGSFGYAIGNVVTLPNAGLIFFNGQGNTATNDHIVITGVTSPTTGGQYKPDEVTGFGGGGAVPEPSSLFAIPALMAAGWYWRRRRK